MLDSVRRHPTNFLLIGIPAALLLIWLPGTSALIFVCSSLALMRLAYMVGRIIDRIAPTHPTLSTILRLVYTNADELTITVFVLVSASGTAAGGLVAGTIAGLVARNCLLYLGMANFMGALRHGRGRFSADTTITLASLLQLGVIGLIMQTLAVGAMSTVGSHDASSAALGARLSIIIATIVLLSYVAYILGVVFHWGERAPRLPTDESARLPFRLRRPHLRWSTVRWLAALLVASVALVLMSSAFGASFDALLRQNASLARYSTILGLFLVPALTGVNDLVEIVGNGWNRENNATFAGVALQAAHMVMVVTPVAVVAGMLLGQPVVVTLNPLELAVTCVGVFFYTWMAGDGEFTWLEGLELVAIWIALAGAAVVWR